MAVPQFRGRGVRPREWSNKRLRTFVLQDREGNVWFGHDRRTRSIPTESVVSVPLQPIRIAVLCRSHRCTLLQTSALAAVTKGLWLQVSGPRFAEIQNDEIVTQCVTGPLIALIVIRMALSGSRLVVVLRLAHERLNTIGSKPGTVTYNFHGAVPAGQD